MSYPPEHLSRCGNLHTYPGMKKFKRGMKGIYYCWEWQKKIGEFELDLIIDQGRLGWVITSCVWTDIHKMVKFDNLVILNNEDHTPMCDIIDDPEYHFRIMML